MRQSVSRDNVAFTGIALDKELATWVEEPVMRAFGNASIGSSGVIDRPKATWTQGAKKVLLIRLDFPDLQGEPLYLYNTNIVITKAHAAAVFNGTNGIRSFFQENSYGKTDLLFSEADVTDVYRMPSNAVWYAAGNGSQFYGAEMQDAAYAAAATQYDLSQYDLIGMVHTYLGGLPGSLMNFAGQANVNGKYFFINGAYDFAVMAHELGHNYGVVHANWWKPVNNTSIGTEQDHLASFVTGAIYGVSREYGDIYDVEGGQNAPFPRDSRSHFNHWFKNLLHWIPDTSVQTVSTSGVYRIYRFDHPDADLVNHTFALKTSRDITRNFWIGYRHEHDSLTNGAYVLFGYNFNRSSELIDCNTPGTNLLDAAVQVGQTLTDTNAGISISPLATGGTAPHEYLDVQVTVQSRICFQTNFVAFETLAGTTDILVNRLGDSTGTTTVGYVFESGTAVPGTHYVGSNGTLNWGPGDSSPKYIPLEALLYPASDRKREFTIQLTNAVNGVVLFNPGKITVSLRPPGNIDPYFPKRMLWFAADCVSFQPDGKMLMAGGNTAEFARYLTNGVRDETFNSARITASYRIFAMEPQPDGKIIMCGYFQSVGGGSQKYIVRLNDDGTIDPSFTPTFNGVVTDVAVQPDGKIVCIGEYNNINGQTCAGICRLRPDGSVDFAFNDIFRTGGMNDVILDNYSSAGEVKILVTGGHRRKTGTQNQGLLRLNADGSLDTSFETGAGLGGGGRFLTLQPDGKIMVSGDFTSFNGDASRQHVLRLHPNGSIDTNFNVSVSNSDFCSVMAMAVQPDGKIVIGGWFNMVNGVTQVGLTRLTSSGELDPTWDNGEGSNTNGASQTSKIIVASDSRVLVVPSTGGWVRGEYGSNVQALYSGLTNRWGFGKFLSPAHGARPGSTIRIAVARVNGSSGPVKLDYSTENGTAIAGVDFVRAQGTLTWVDGDTSPKTITVSCNPGAISGHSFNLNLGIPRDGIYLGNIAQSTINISGNYSYEVWQGENFDGAQQADSNVSGISASPAGDGVHNLVKYAFGLDPFSQVTTNLPSGMFTGERLQLSFTRDPIRSDLQYEVQTSNDLSVWSAIARSSGGNITTNMNAFSVAETPINSIFSVTVDDSATVETVSPRFIRLRLSQ